MRDQIFPFIEVPGPVKQVGYYTVRVKLLTGFKDNPKPNEWVKPIYLTYKVKADQQVLPGESFEVVTPRGKRVVIIIEIDAIKKDTQPGIEYKFLDEVLVNESQEAKG